jgi:hypothetical protein
MVALHLHQLTGEGYICVPVHPLCHVCQVREKTQQT